MLERVPNALAVRRALLDLLKQAKRYGLIESHVQYILESNPDDPYLRLDLAQAFDRQDKTKEAKEEIERFRKLRLGDNRRKAWQYLRGLGLGKYVDEIPVQQQSSLPPAQQSEPVVP